MKILNPTNLESRTIIKGEHYFVPPHGFISNIDEETAKSILRLHEWLKLEEDGHFVSNIPAVVIPATVEIPVVEEKPKVKKNAKK